MPNTHLTDAQMLRKILAETKDPSTRGALKRAIKNAMVLVNFTPESLREYGLTKKSMRTPNIQDVTKRGSGYINKKWLKKGKKNGKA